MEDDARRAILYGNILRPPLWNTFPVEADVEETGGWGWEGEEGEATTINSEPDNDYLVSADGTRLSYRYFVKKRVDKGIIRWRR